MRAYVHTYLHNTYTHTHARTHTHTYIHSTYVRTCTPVSLMVKINESPKSDVYNFINAESAHTSHII